MAKTSFTKLKCQVNKDIIPVQIGEETIGVKQYLPLQEKLALIERVVNQGQSENYDYANPMLTKALMEMEIAYTYTDISFTEKQKEDFSKLYDMIKSSGVLNIILEAIPASEMKELQEGVHTSLQAIYNYRNSIKGILEDVGNKYAQTNLDTNEIVSKLGDPENLSFIRDLLTKFN